MGSHSSGSSVSQILRKLILETGDLARYLQLSANQSQALESGARVILSSESSIIGE